MKKKLLLILLLLSLTLTIVGCSEKKDTKESEVTISEEEKEEIRKNKKIEKYLEKIGKDFYEDYYYNNIENTTKDVKEFLKKYEEIGIKVNFENLSRYIVVSGKDDGEYYQILDIDFDDQETKIIIYPHDPYEKTDYNLTTEIELNNKR